MEEKLNRLRDSMDKTVLKNGRMSKSEKEKILLNAQQDTERKDPFLAPILSFVFILTFLFLVSIFFYNQVFNEGGFIMVSLDQLFLWILLFLFIIAGTIFLISQRQNKYFRTYLVTLPTLSLAAACLLFFQSDTSVTNVQTPSAAQSLEKTDVETETVALDRKIRDAIYEKLDIMTDIDEKRIEELVVSVDEKNVELVLGASGIGYMEEIRNKLVVDSQAAIQLVFENEQVQTASFQWKVQHYPNPTGAERAGERQYEVALSYQLSREQYEKINWDSFNLEELQKTTQGYEIQPFLLQN
ncbi:hypothetical protein ACFYKX_13470 [Cytobacillus sp. FJAT-54145]|uniref:Uncharacterized protein n=1 Tax=Cytobacillus spartinae TaxID=3299023 RepID=A0ABW6KBI7_9BACI